MRPFALLGAFLICFWFNEGYIFLNALCTAFVNDANMSAHRTDYKHLPVELLTDPEQSITGLLPYIQFVKRAVLHEEVFAMFKGHKDYTQVLEHVSSELGNL